MLGSRRGMAAIGTSQTLVPPHAGLLAVLVGITMGWADLVQGAGVGDGGWQGFLDQGGLMGHLEEALGTWGCWGCEGWFGGRGGRGYIER
jgi:hypothetical protein